MTPLRYHIVRACGRIGGTVLLVFLWASFAHAATPLATSAHGAVSVPAFLRSFPFATVPLAAALTARSVQVSQEEHSLPDWKRRWDEARRLAVAGDLARAARLYRELLAEKAIDAARWELATILMALGQDAEAVDAVEALSAEAPERSDYLHALAVMELHLGRLSAAAATFARLYALLPDDPVPLAGEAHALLAAGERAAALPLLLELWRMAPRTAGLREGVASVAFAQGEYEAAWPHLLALASGPDPAPRVLAMAARTASALGHAEEAVGLWQRYALAQPDDLEARELLAHTLSQQGQLRQAMPHLLAMRAKRPDDLALLKRIGQGYVALAEFSRALAPLQAYAARRPEDSEAALALVTVHEALGRKDATLQAMARYLALEPDPDPGTLLRAVRLFVEAGAHAEAVLALRQLLAARPGDPALLTELVRELLALGREEEALPLCRELTRVQPAQISHQRQLAAVLEHLGQEQELLATLTVIHRLDPGDQGVGLRLFSHYVAANDPARASAVLTVLEGQGKPLPPPFFYWRGVLHMQRQEFSLALTDLEEVLRSDPGHPDARRQALVAAGREGRMARVRVHARALIADTGEVTVERMLLVARAYADCRAESEARAWFTRICDGPAPDQVTATIRDQAFLGLSETYLREGRPYEAEEALRRGLVVTSDRQLFLTRLFSLALGQGRLAEAKGWLAALRPLATKSPWRLQLLEATLHTALGEGRQARRVLSSVAEALSAVERGARDGDPTPRAERLTLAAQWLKAERPGEAVKQAALVLAAAPDDLEAQVILRKVKGEDRMGRAPLDPSVLGHDQLCRLATIYGRYDLPAEMIGTARQALARTPRSLPANLLLVEALVTRGDLAAAISRLDRLAAEYPREFALKARSALLRFRQGELPVVAELLNSEEGRSWPELRLLAARIVWRQHRWQEAIALYQEELLPTVASQLRRASMASGENPPPLSRRRSIWEVVTRDPGPDPELVMADQLMAPAAVMAALDQEKTPMAQAAASLVARYRWQTQFAMELAPRQAVARREYTIARKQYEDLLARYPAEQIVLFDLAGVYSRLDTLGLEAAAYERLTRAGVDFPELAEARRRNRLHQQPRVTVTAGFQSAAGRHGYLDRDKVWEAFSVWASPYTRHEAEVSMERSNYVAGSSTAKVRASRAMASYSAGLMSGLTVKGAGGAQRLDDDGDTALLGSVQVIGKVGDGLTGTLALEREVVDDTIASLRRHVLRQDLRGGLSLDPLPRLAVGGNYLARVYSDDNWTTGYDLWSSYLLFAEPTFLRLSYSYDYKESRVGGSPQVPTADGFGADDHPYWAPKNYWLNQIGLFFKHSLADDALGRGAPQYYTVEYRVGHDVDGYAAQTVRAGIHAEITSSCLLEAMAEVVTSQAVRKEEYRLGASYRW